MDNSIQGRVSNALRLQIGIFGRMNAGKSSLINAITGQNVSIISSTPGTTTDIVSKPIELQGVGACSFLDTAGFDDIGDLGFERVKASKRASERVDIALIVFHPVGSIDTELSWIEKFKTLRTPIIGVLNYADIFPEVVVAERKRTIEELGLKTIVTSAINRVGIEDVLTAIREIVGVKKKRSLTDSVAKPGDIVMLVTPQDCFHAPEGRISQPEVQVIRDLLDKDCFVMFATSVNLDEALTNLRTPPDLLIVDSSIFKEVYAKKPKESKITSFSVLFSGFKGDIQYFAESVYAIDNLKENSRILISECCTHTMMEDDNGRVKIPQMINQKCGFVVPFDFVSGKDFPTDISKYDLIIQCGGCMLNRKTIMSRVLYAKQNKIPMTNYGMIFAFMGGFFEDITLPAAQGEV